MPPPVVDRSRVEAELAALTTLIEALKAEADLAPAKGTDKGSALPPTTLSTYEQQCQSWLADLDRQQLTVAVVGDPHTGKTTLIEWLTAAAILEADLAAMTWREIPLTPDLEPADLAPVDASGSGSERINTEFSSQFQAADAVVLLTDGDLTASAWALLKDCVMAGQGAVLVFNKSDHYDLADQQIILTQLQQQVATLPASVAVVKAAAAPRPIKVRRHQAMVPWTNGWNPLPPFWQRSPPP
ncbi:MAG: hypothetical protein HC922_10000 [Leptolyngbyaceae cyanobacterium SM2_3_12]|nr:hypothetical protein [Leptolyngbyaceae cyanobacterium SM2_3_12]